jgi:potassium efflux system protein
MRWTLFLLCVLLPLLSAAEENSTVELPIDLEQVNDKLQKLDDKDPAPLADLYNQILDEAKLFEEHRQKSMAFQQALDQFVDISNELNKKREEFEKLEDFDVPETQAEVKLMLAQKNARQVQLTSRIGVLNQRSNLINQRINQIPEEIEEARTALTEIDREPVTKSADPAVEEARKWLRTMRISRQNMLIQMLELEQLSANNRAELARAETALEKASLERRNQELTQLRDALTRMRRQETEELLESTTQVSTEETVSHPLIQQQQQQIVELANQLKLLVSLIEDTTKRKDKTDLQAEQLAQEMSLLEQQLSLSEVGAELGERLLAQSAKLKEFTADKNLSELLDKARLERFHYREQLQALEDADAYIREQIKQAATLLTPGQRETLQVQVQDRRKLLKQINQLQDQYVFELAKYQASEQQRQGNAKALQALVSSNLLWVANTQPIGLDSFKKTLVGLSYLGDERVWAEVTNTAMQRPLLLFLTIMVTIIATILHLSRRNWYFTRLRLLCEPVGRVSYDSMSYTIRALFLTLCMSVTYVAPLLMLSQLFAGDKWQTPYSASLGQVFYAISGLLFAALTIHFLAKPNGVLRGHFLWREHPLSEIVGAIRRFITLAIPITAFLAFIDARADTGLEAGSGRGLFAILCILTSILLWRSLGQLLRHTSHSNRVRRWIRLAKWTIPLLPLLSIVAAAMGYYYSAGVLLDRELDTLLLAAFFWLVYLLAHRLMQIQERRLAFERARSKRAELIAQRQKELEEGDEFKPAGTEGNIDLEVEEVDIDTLKAQALGLLRMFLIVGFFSAALALWSDVLQAFSWLQDIVLWQTLASGSDSQLQNITLLSMLMALLVLILTFFVTRNLPSLLELSLLQHMDLETGVSYAVTTVSRYLVMMIGILLGFNLIGFDWSKLQWLVAALGVGLGFGLQEIFANMVSGLIILFERPIRPGDTVTINNMSGTISKINIRATTIIDWDLKEILIPNKTFITQEFINWSLSESTTRVVIRVGVAYGSDLELVEKLLLEATRECPQVLEDPSPAVFLLNFGNNSCDFEVRVFTRETGHRLAVTHRMHQLITKKFEQHDITIPFPQLDVYMHRSNPKPAPEGG